MKRDMIIHDEGCHTEAVGMHTMRRRPYETLSITSVYTTPGSAILAGSIVKDSTIKAAGQELGPDYNMQSGLIDGQTSTKTFNHDWE